jgi:hypothetical protein
MIKKKFQFVKDKNLLNNMELSIGKPVQRLERMLTKCFKRSQIDYIKYRRPKDLKLKLKERK